MSAAELQAIERAMNAHVQRCLHCVRGDPCQRYRLLQARQKRLEGRRR